MKQHKYTVPEAQIVMGRGRPITLPAWLVADIIEALDGFGTVSLDNASSSLIGLVVEQAEEEHYTAVVGGPEPAP